MMISSYGNNLKLFFFFKKNIYIYIELENEATCNASLADRLAALETRTFARTDTHIPTYPAIPEQRAPKRNAATVIYAEVDLHQQF